MQFGRLGSGFSRLGSQGSAGDPLAPAAPVLDLDNASDTGTSSTDDITGDNTPTILIDFPEGLVEDWVLDFQDNGVDVSGFPRAVTAGEEAAGAVNLGLSALSDGSHTLRCRVTNGVHVGAWGSLAIEVWTSGPTITTAATASVAENAMLSVTLAASRSATFAIRTSGEDAASLDYDKFEISGTTLRWASNGTKNYESPNDSNTDNDYVVVVRATDLVGNTTDKTVTVSVTNVNEAPTVANTISNQTAYVGSAFSFQFNSNTFADVDAGDTLTYTAALSDGSALPSWLTFTAGTRTFSGTASSGDIGTITVRVTATDSGSLNVNTTFDIVVSSVAPATVAWTDTKTNTAGGASITYAGMSFGTDDPNRVVAVLLNHRDTAALGSITAVTIGGISAHHASGSNSSNSVSLAQCDCWYVDHATDGLTATSGDVVVTYSVSTARSMCHAYRITTTTSIPSDAKTNASGSATSLATSAALTIPTNGVGIATAMARNSATATDAAYSGTGWVEDTGSQVLNLSTASTTDAASNTTAGSTTPTMSMTGAGASEMGISAVAWGP